MNTDKSMMAILMGCIVALVLILFVQCATASSEVELDNGYNITVPEGWNVVVLPTGYNLNPYDAKKNPKGKLPGWGGWPKYTAYLESIGCGGDGLVISPAVCPPQPEIYKPYTQCYFEPVQVKEEESCLVISPATSCDD